MGKTDNLSTTDPAKKLGVDLDLMINALKLTKFCMKRCDLAENFSETVLSEIDQECLS